MQLFSAVFLWLCCIEISKGWSKLKPFQHKLCSSKNSIFMTSIFFLNVKPYNFMNILSQELGTLYET